MRKIKIVGFTFGVITVVFSIISMIIAISNGVGLYSKQTIVFSGISSVSLLISSIIMLIVQVKMRKENKIEFRKKHKMRDVNLVDERLKNFKVDNDKPYALLKVKIIRLIDLEYQPGWCEVIFEDINKNDISVIDKIPVIYYDFDYDYEKLDFEIKKSPLETYIPCVVLKQEDNIVEIDISYVLGLEDSNNNSIFYVSEESLIK